jgi:5-formyltetrahydrofolate cyclo-ligase
MLRTAKTKDVKALKNDIRKRILKLLRNQKEEERFKKSRIIWEKLVKRPEFARASTVLFYASFDGEVDTFEMMKQARELGKRIALPTIVRLQKDLIPTMMEEEDFEIGPYGVKQPKSLWGRSLDVNDIDLVIVPGVAFDKQNNRLGRGAGYYDRFLAKCPASLPVLGLAFDFQILDCLPHPEGHDVPVSGVIVN